MQRRVRHRIIEGEGTFELVDRVRKFAQVGEAEPQRAMPYHTAHGMVLLGPQP